MGSFGRTISNKGKYCASATLRNSWFITAFKLGHFLALSK
jgi:hypothetical protein